ncbi:anti-sigma factor domain-containing protein [Sphingomonas sp. LY160]|uniref:anti-sigma factor n=1 Tax=Sphingomonas sp. LY160 TaxID=3095342 RepID=UPI002ADECFFE|nr:anti-sigma factor [Sphingomonas sp. LY160]MEA1070977.1 anti-sigma factor [Sphingomonas sp. LY160]
MSADDPERDLLAAELALRLLDGRELEEARALAELDPEFAREVAAWDERFAPLFDQIQSVEPDASVWSRIQAAIGGDRVDGMEGPTVVALKRRVKLWSNVALAASAVAAALAVVVVPGLIRPEPTAPIEQPAPQPTAPTMLAKVISEDRATAYVVTVASDHRSMMVMPAVAAAPEGRVHELWLIGGDGVPHSLGLIDTATPTRIAVAAPLSNAMRAQDTIAVTVEPPGGGPGGKPSGAPIAAGPLANI